MIGTVGLAEYVSAAFEMIGLGLLCWEVHLGHKYEEITAELILPAELTFLYTCKNYEAFYIACRLDQGDTPEQARRQVADFGPSVLEKVVEEQWIDLAPQSAQTIHRFKTVTSAAATKARNVRLLSGTVLLIGAVVIRVVTSLYAAG